MAPSQQPDLSELFTAHLLNRNTRIQADLVEQLFHSTEKPLARALQAANSGDDTGPEKVSVKMKRETLAGIARSHLHQFMNAFRRLGSIDHDGDVSCHNSPLIVSLADGRRADKKTRQFCAVFSFEQ